MNHQELREAIFGRKPRYSEKFKPLMERISIKGDLTGKGDFSTFGAFFADISHWKPTPIRDFILMTLLNRTEKFDNFSWNWLSLENSSEENVSNFITMLIREMEAYANTGLIYLQDKWDNEKMLFNSPFVFVDILQELPKNNKESLAQTELLSNAE